VTTAVASAPTREPHYRAVVFGDFVDLELRADGDGRTFEGIALPWEVETDLDGYETEVWTRGSFNHQVRAANRISAAYGHIPLGGSLIGSLRTLRDDAGGLFVSGRISDVPDGNTALTLMTDKALRELSIGFYRVPGGDTVTRRENYGILRRYTKANLFEVAIVPMGQYGRKAAVSGLRQQGEPGGRERIEVRQLVVSLDGQSASVPFGGALSDAVRTLLGPASPPTPVVDATLSGPADPTVSLDSSVTAVDAMLANLPEL
jgi:HK97 family phage prohead protease